MWCFFYIMKIQDFFFREAEPYPFNLTTFVLTMQHTWETLL